MSPATLARLAADPRAALLAAVAASPARPVRPYIVWHDPAAPAVIRARPAPQRPLQRGEARRYAARTIPAPVLAAGAYAYLFASGPTDARARYAADFAPFLAYDQAHAA